MCFRKSSREWIYSISTSPRRRKNRIALGPDGPCVLYENMSSSGHIVYRPRTRRGYTIPPARLRWYEYISATLRYLEYNWLNRMNYCVWLQFRFHSVLLFDSSYNGFSVWTWIQCMFESLQPSHWVFHLVQYYGSNVCIHILHIALTAWADKTMKKWLKLAGNYQARA